MIIVMMMGQVANAQNCEAKLAKCDAAVEAGEQYIKGLEAHVKQQDEFIELQDKQLQSLNALLDQEKKWYEEPSFLVPTTALLTILVLGELREAAP